jgi:hypothetical protein
MTSSGSSRYAEIRGERREVWEKEMIFLLVHEPLGAIVGTYKSKKFLVEFPPKAIMVMFH